MSAVQPISQCREIHTSSSGLESDSGFEEISSAHGHASHGSHGRHGRGVEAGSLSSQDWEYLEERSSSSLSGDRHEKASMLSYSEVEGEECESQIFFMQRQQQLLSSSGLRQTLSDTPASVGPPSALTLSSSTNEMTTNLNSSMEHRLLDQIASLTRDLGGTKEELQTLVVANSQLVDENKAIKAQVLDLQEKLRLKDEEKQKVHERRPQVARPIVGSQSHGQDQSRGFRKQTRRMSGMGMPDDFDLGNAGMAVATGCLMFALIKKKFLFGSFALAGVATSLWVMMEEMDEEPGKKKPMTYGNQSGRING